MSTTLRVFQILEKKCLSRQVTLRGENNMKLEMLEFVIKLKGCQVKTSPGVEEVLANIFAGKIREQKPQL